MNKEMKKLDDQQMGNVAGGTLTQDEALAKALEHANLKKDQLDFLKKVELDYEHGRKVYEVSFYKGGFEYEFDIDAETGSILKFKKDWDWSQLISPSRAPLPMGCLTDASERRNDDEEKATCCSDRARDSCRGDRRLASVREEHGPEHCACRRGPAQITGP